MNVSRRHPVAHPAVRYMRAAHDARAAGSFESAFRAIGLGLLYCVRRGCLTYVDLFAKLLTLTNDHYLAGRAVIGCSFCARKEIAERELMLGHGGAICRDCCLKFAEFFRKRHG